MFPQRRTRSLDIDRHRCGASPARRCQRPGPNLPFVSGANGPAIGPVLLRYAPSVLPFGCRRWGRFDALCTNRAAFRREWATGKAYILGGRSSSIIDAYHFEFRARPRPDSPRRQTEKPLHTDAILTGMEGDVRIGPGRPILISTRRNRPPGLQYRRRSACLPCASWSCCPFCRTCSRSWPG